MKKEFINPPALLQPRGYTQVVTVREGATMIFIAGQVGIDANGNVGEDLPTQTTQVFENLKSALAAAGATFDDVVKTTIYIVNYQSSDRALIGEIRNRYISTEHAPASTLVGVQALAFEGLFIEIEATAIIG